MGLMTFLSFELKHHFFYMCAYGILEKKIKVHWNISYLVINLEKNWITSITNSWLNIKSKIRNFPNLKGSNRKVNFLASHLFLTGSHPPHINMAFPWSYLYFSFGPFCYICSCQRNYLNSISLYFKLAVKRNRKYTLLLVYWILILP